MLFLVYFLVLFVLIGFSLSFFFQCAFFLWFSELSVTLLAESSFELHISPLGIVLILKTLSLPILHIPCSTSHGLYPMFCIPCYIFHVTYPMFHTPCSVSHAMYPVLPTSSLFPLVSLMVLRVLMRASVPTSNLYVQLNLHTHPVPLLSLT